MNYWEVSRFAALALARSPRLTAPTQKYGAVAFDSNQKAVLTTCQLRYKPVLPTSGSATPANALNGKGAEDPPAREQGVIDCCFSFTIRRDPYGIPTLIVGNFIKC